MMPVIYSTILKIEFRLWKVTIGVNTHLLLDSLGASPSDFFCPQLFPSDVASWAVNSLLQFVTKVYYFLGLPLVLLFVNLNCRLKLSTGATVVCLKGTVLVLEGVSRGVASAKTARLLQCAFPWWWYSILYGGGRQAPCWMFSANI